MHRHRFAVVESDVGDTRERRCGREANRRGRGGEFTQCLEQAGIGPCQVGGGEHHAPTGRSGRPVGRGCSGGVLLELLDQHLGEGLHAPLERRRSGQDPIGSRGGELFGHSIDHEERQRAAVGQLGLDEAIGRGEVVADRLGVQLGADHHEACAEVAQVLCSARAQLVGGDPDVTSRRGGGDRFGEDVLAGTHQSRVGFGATGIDSGGDVERQQRQGDELVTVQRGGESFRSGRRRSGVGDQWGWDLERHRDIDLRGEVDRLVESSAGEIDRRRVGVWSWCRRDRDDRQVDGGSDLDVGVVGAREPLDHRARRRHDVVVGWIADQQLHPQRVDTGTVHLQTRLDALDHVGADVERQADRSVVGAFQQRAGVEGDTVDGIARDAIEGVRVDVASHESADVVGVGERRVVGDLQRERYRLGDLGFGFDRRFDRCSRVGGRVGGRVGRRRGRRRDQLQRVTVEAAQQVPEFDVAVGVGGELLADQLEAGLIDGLGGSQVGRVGRRRWRG